ncbi:MAG: hypothetical protein N3I35_14230 [Clostridia bacterium]|nr:hypothetical protein [Clostridia bacterium]
MKFLRTKAVVIFITVISILCIIAAGIAIEVSIVMIKKKDQALKPLAAQPTKSIEASVKPVKANKLEEQAFYFNGEVIEGLKAYSDEKESFFIPMDLLLQKLGIGFRFFSSDDIFEFSIHNEKVKMILNKSEVEIDGRKVKLDSAVLTAKNHILVSTEIFDFLKGFSVDKYLSKNTVFINYFPDLKNGINGIRLLRTENETVEISDLLNEKQFWKSEGKNSDNVRIETSKENTGYTIKRDNKVYVFCPDGMKNPRLTDISQSAAWSADGKYLYWIDPVKGISYLYDVREGIMRKLGDYFLRMRDAKPKDRNYKLFSNGGILYEYKQGKRYKRITFTDPEYPVNYTFIERRGKTVIEGRVSFSPDADRVLYYKAGEGYYTAVVDGTRQAFIGAGSGAVWISSNKILLYTAEDKFLVTSDGMYREKTAGIWKVLGQSTDGAVFYTDGRTLYCEAEKGEVQVFKLNISLDYVFALDRQGPYLGVSKADDKTYIISKGKTKEIGNSSLLRSFGGKGINEYGYSISGSPGGKYTAAVRSLEGFLGIDLLDNKKAEVRRFTLNYNVENLSHLDKCNMTWVSDDTLILSTANRGWLIDLKDKPGIYDWVEGSGSRIYGIYVNKKG